MNQERPTTDTARANALATKSWTAYVWPLLLTVLALAILLPGTWHWSWPAGLLLLIVGISFAAYKVMMLRSFDLYWDDNGVWLYSGVLPWEKGVRGVKWRDLDEASYYKSMWSWLSKSYSIRVGHRFTKSNEVSLTHMARGEDAVVAINSQHQYLVQNNLLT